MNLRTDIVFLSRLLGKAGKALTLVAGLVAMITAYYLATQPESPPIYAAQQQAPEPRDRSMQDFADGMRTLLNTGTVDKAFVSEWSDMLQYPLHIDIWHQQKFLGESMAFGIHVPDVLRDLHGNYQTLSGRSQNPVPDDAIIYITALYQPKSYDALGAHSRNGLTRFLSPAKHALIAECGQTHAIMPALRWATRGFADGWAAAITYLKWVGCDAIKLEGGLGKITRFQTREWIQYAKGKPAEIREAGDRIADRSATSTTMIKTLLKQQASWLDTHLSPEGKLPYLYDPLTDSASKDNQLIRQWFGILALGKLAQLNPTTERKEHFLRAVSYAMHQFYVQKKSAAYFKLNNTADLATNAVAAQALAIAMEYDTRYQKPYTAIINTIWAQKRDDGSFNTTLLPATNAGDDLDFAPLISLQSLLQAMELKRLNAPPTDLIPTFDYYYSQWQKRRSLYGASWHLIGFSTLERALQNPPSGLSKAILTIADELVRCQTTATDVSAYHGAFNENSCRDPSPQPLSTAVRMEGLVHAYRLAVTIQDQERMKTYRNAIQHALHYIHQSAITDANRFYLKNPDKALGGIRLRPRQPLIRIDAPGHVVNALIEMQRY